MRFVLLLMVSLVSLMEAPAWARGPIVAVFDMEDKGSGLAPEVLGKLGDYLSVLLTQGGYQVMARSEIRDRLKEQKKETYKSCYDQSCQIEMGRELAAEKTLATWVLKVGETCQVTATLYDLKKGTTELAAIHEAARLAATKKVEALEKTHQAANAEELKKARLEAKEAKERADKAEVAMREEKKKAEEALLEAEKARKNPEGLPTERFNLGIAFTFISPDVTEMENDLHDHPDRSGLYEGGFGLAIKLDFMLTSYLSVGGYLAYTMGEFREFDIPAGYEDEYSTMHIMNALATVKGRFNLGTVEFRPGLAAGYQHHDGGPSGKVDGLGLSAFVETAFYLSRHFGLTLELGMNILPVSSGNEGDMTFIIPLLYISLGAEYCD